MSTAVSRSLRSLISKRCADIPDEVMQRVPAGFNGNLHWQLGHLVVTPALLTYGRCGVDLPLPEAMVAAFRKGTGPTDGGDAFSRAELTEGLTGILDRIEADVAAGVLADYEAYQTSAGVLLSSVPEALAFNGVHDGIHLGYTLALARVASQG